MTRKGSQNVDVDQIQDFMFTWNGHIVILEKNRYAPGFIMKRCICLFGWMETTPISADWDKLLRCFINWARAGQCGEDSYAIAEKLEVIRTDEKANSFYSRFKLDPSDRRDLDNYCYDQAMSELNFKPKFG